MVKTFESDFNKIKSHLENDIKFSFTRFSDGELFVLQNKRLELNEDHFIIGNDIGNGWYNKEEQKKFIPNEHEFFRLKLEECLQFNDPLFYRGICTAPDTTNDVFNWMVNLAGGDSETLTWSNLFINSNYERFLSEIVPIFSKRKIIFIVNENAKFDDLSFKVDYDFRVGTNCFINNYSLIDDIKKFITDKFIEDYLFLVSAASLSNLLIHELHKFSNKNTYLEIGSTLNPILGMTGWTGSRGYLKEYWMNYPRNYLNQVCTWN